MARISPIVEREMSPDQAGFREGRSCCSQVLNLTQYIEDGFELGKITGTVFVDLTAAYDTVNHRLLLLKVAKVIRNRNTILIIQSLLSNRLFFVEMDGKRSRWRKQKNGLPQGSVLAPILFNIYTNDQPQFRDIRRFIYADDLCLAVQSNSFETIERKLSDALKDLDGYYKQNFLNANPDKTQVCAFHLKNHQARRELNITWNNKKLKNDTFPVYLGVTLDRTLSFKEHTRKVKEKVATRNSLLRKLANSKWGANPQTLRQTALALNYSAAEYCSPVWERSCHSHNVDAELNQTCRIITGALRPTPLPVLCRLVGIAPPNIRRATQSKVEKYKQEYDSRHSLYDHHAVRQRLESRRSFMTINSINPKESSNYRLKCWREMDNHSPSGAIQTPSESLPEGVDLCRRDWVTLNRARTRVARTGDNLQKWGLAPSAECPCGHSYQTMEHILSDCSLGPVCSDSDLLECNQTALQWIQCWHDKI